MMAGLLVWEVAERQYFYREEVWLLLCFKLNFCYAVFLSSGYFLLSAALYISYFGL